MEKHHAREQGVMGIMRAIGDRMLANLDRIIHVRENQDHLGTIGNIMHVIRTAVTQHAHLKQRKNHPNVLSS